MYNSTIVDNLDEWNFVVNITLIWLFLIPIGLSVASFFLLPKLAPRQFSAKESAAFAGAGTLIGCIIMAIGFYVSIGFKTTDYEIWNGQITSKSRVHGHYVRSYDCNCRQVCSGSGQSESCSEKCDTCYEDRYIVDWSCASTIGSFTIQHLDTTSKSVYNTPDPQRYTLAYVGEPASKVMEYTNYVQAVPNSLFRPSSTELKAAFANKIPVYPLGIYNNYRINRAITVGVPVPDLAEWNEHISNMLRTLGPTKQVNAILVFVNTADPNYVYALRDAWQGAEKNDVVLVIGSTSYPKIDWVDVISWTDSQMFKVSLRDEVLALEDIDREKVMSTLESTIKSSFVRKRMRDFKYLESEIDPPTWVLTSMVGFIFVSFLGFWLFWWYENRKYGVHAKRTVYNALHINHGFRR